MSTSHLPLGQDYEFHRKVYRRFMNQVDADCPHWIVGAKLVPSSCTIRIDRGTFRYELSYNTGKDHPIVTFSVCRPDRRANTKGLLISLIVKECSRDPIYDEVYELIDDVRKRKARREYELEQLKEAQLRDDILENLE